MNSSGGKSKSELSAIAAFISHPMCNRLAGDLRLLGVELVVSPGFRKNEPLKTGMEPEIS